MWDLSLGTPSGTHIREVYILWERILAVLTQLMEGYPSLLQAFQLSCSPREKKKKKCSQKGLGLQKLYIGEILLMVKGSSGEKKKGDNMCKNRWVI